MVKIPYIENKFNFKNLYLFPKFDLKLRWMKKKHHFKFLFIIIIIGFQILTLIFKNIFKWYML